MKIAACYNLPMVEKYINSLTLTLFFVFLTSVSFAAEKKSRKSNKPYTFGGTTIVGVQEAAKNLVIVPWKSRQDWVELKHKSQVKRFPIVAIDELDVDSVDQNINVHTE